MERVTRTGPALFLLLVLAAAAGSFCLALPYQLDDYTVIPHGMRSLEDIGDGLSALWSGEALPEGPGTYLFRPLPWATYAAEVAILGGRADATLSHANALLFHLATVLLVFWVGRRWSWIAGFAAAACFAIHPAGAQAISWSAARGDLLLPLMTIPAVCCALRARRANHAGFALAAGVFAAGMIACKATGLAYLPLAFGPLLIGPDDRDRLRPRLVLIGLVPVIPIFLVRWWFVGTMSPIYDGGVAFSSSALPRMVAAAPALLRHLLVPWNNNEEALDFAEPVAHHLLPAVGSWESQDSAALCVALIPLSALLCAPRRYGRVLLRLLPVLALLAFPPLFLFSEASAAAAARTLYSPLMVVALLLGVAVAVLFEHGLRSPRGVVAAALSVLAVALMIDAHVPLRRLEHHAGTLIERRLDAVEEAYRDGPEDLAVVLIDGDAEFAGIPLLGPIAGAAVRWPFREPERILFPVRDQDALVESGVLATYPGPARLIEVIHHRPRSAGDIPALPIGPIVLRRAREPGRWIPTGPIPPRAIAGLRLLTSPGPEQTLRVEIETDRTLVHGTVTFPEGISELLLGIEATPAWQRSALLEQVLLSPIGVRGGEPRLGAPPGLVATLPPLRRSAPREGARLPLGQVPEFQVGGLPPRTTLRLSVLLRYQGFALKMVHEIGPDDQEHLEGGLVACRPFRRYRVRGSMPDLYWETLEPKFEAHLGVLGVRAVTALIEVSWTAEAVSPDGRWVSARSARGRFTLVP